MTLQEKVTVIYGAGDAIGSAVSRAFTQERAEFFLLTSRLGGERS